MMQIMLMREILIILKKFHDQIEKKQVKILHEDLFKPLQNLKIIISIGFI